MQALAAAEISSGGAPASTASWKSAMRHSPSKTGTLARVCSISSRARATSKSEAPPALACPTVTS